MPTMSGPVHARVPGNAPFNSSATGAATRFRWQLLLICAIGCALRVAVVVQGRSDSLSGDGFAYSGQANLNAEGHWFVSVFDGGKFPDALHPPAWTFLLTVWALLGQHSFFSQQLLAAGVGTLTVGVVGLAGRRIGSGPAGLLAAGIAALYPGLWLYERAILSETLLLLGIAVFVLLVYTFRTGLSAGSAALLGAVCGLLALTRSEEILVFPFVVAPLLLADREVDWRRRIGRLVLSGLSLLAVVTPWTIYNLGRFQRPVLLSNNSGSTFDQSNCNITYYGPLTGSYSLGCLAPLSATEARQDQSLQSVDRFHQGMQYLRHHLSRLPVVLVAREGRAFGFWAPFQQVQLDAAWGGGGPAGLGPPYTPVALWVDRMALFGYWLLLIPAAAGVLVLRRRRTPVYPLLGFFGIVIVTVATTYGEPRYRAAVEVPLVLLAAVGLCAASSRVRRGRGSPEDRDQLAAHSAGTENGDR